jgi:hypothetical protein
MNAREISVCPANQHPAGTASYAVFRFHGPGPVITGVKGYRRSNQLAGFQILKKHNYHVLSFKKNRLQIHNYTNDG